MRYSAQFIVLIIYSLIDLSQGLYANSASECKSQGYLNCLTNTGQCTEDKFFCADQCTVGSTCFFKCCKSGYCQMLCEGQNNNSGFPDNDFNNSSSSSSSKKVNIVVIVLPIVFGIVGLIIFVVTCVVCIRQRKKKIQLKQQQQKYEQNQQMPITQQQINQGTINTQLYNLPQMNGQAIQMQPTQQVYGYPLYQQQYPIIDPTLNYPQQPNMQMQTFEMSHNQPQQDNQQKQSNYGIQQQIQLQPIIQQQPSHYMQSHIHQQGNQMYSNVNVQNVLMPQHQSIYTPQQIMDSQAKLQSNPNITCM